MSRNGHGHGWEGARVIDEVRLGGLPLRPSLGWEYLVDEGGRSETPRIDLSKDHQPTEVRTSTHGLNDIGPCDRHIEVSGVDGFAVWMDSLTEYNLSPDIFASRRDQRMIRRSEDHSEAKYTYSFPMRTAPPIHFHSHIRSHACIYLLSTTTVPSLI